MPKRVVKHLSWEVLLEQMSDTPAMLRREKRYLIKQSLKEITRFESTHVSPSDLWQLASATFAAYHLERYTQAEALASQAIELAKEKTDDRNAGDAMHKGYTVHGLLALKAKNTQVAIHHLHASANVPSTPVLSSFGPSMLLAKELLRRGETQAVMTYLNLCRVFWTHGESWLEVWEVKIKGGRIPNFCMNLD